MRVVDGPEPRRVVDVGEVVGKIGIIEPYDAIRKAGIHPPAMQRAARAWAIRYAPEELIINMRPGLPCILGWYAVQRNWPLTCVAARNQLERAPSDIQFTLYDLWHRADRKHVAADVHERDMLIRDVVPLLTIGHVMARQVPIMEHRVLESGA